ncbi:MAG TPA: cell division protein FtsZ, partial [Streptomyces sp.]|nr:cell division protein FtsZ [Streptomyces sp.]
DDSAGTSPRGSSEDADAGRPSLGLLAPREEEAPAAEPAPSAEVPPQVPSARPYQDSPAEELDVPDFLK